MGRPITAWVRGYPERLERWKPGKLTEPGQSGFQFSRIPGSHRCPLARIGLRLIGEMISIHLRVQSRGIPAARSGPISNA